MASQKPAPPKLDGEIASFIYQSPIPYHVAVSSNFALLIDKSIKKNPILSYPSVTCEYADEFKIFALDDKEA
jgi:hypothetical protein